MALNGYEYTLEQCDVPKVRHASLQEYRDYRRKCLKYLNGTSNTSVKNQIHSLAWHTAVFRTLNEARRLEPNRVVSDAFWELTSAGYASLMATGIRKLVDKDPRTDSVWNVIGEIEKRPELLTREKFVCYDGIPFNSQAGEEKYFKSLASHDSVNVLRLPTKGPDAWTTSQVLHKAFDRLSSPTTKRKRTDQVKPSLVRSLKDHLSHPAINKVCTLADRVVAHAERIAEGASPIEIPTYNDIDEALKEIVRVTNFLSSYFFYETSFSSIVPVPQFDHLKGVENPWVTAANLPRLYDFWKELSDSMSEWTDNTLDYFVQNTISTNREDV